MNVQIINKSKHETPSYETEGAAGMDLRANIEEAIILKPLERTIVKTGLFIALPVGLHYLLVLKHKFAQEVDWLLKKELRF